jgi:hypothetical protein
MTCAKKRLFHYAALSTIAFFLSCGNSTPNQVPDTFTGMNEVGSDTLSGEDMIKLLNMPVDSEAADKFFSNLGPKEVDNDAKFPHWLFFKGGVEVVVNPETNTIHCIFLMGNNPSLGFSTYGGFLPMDLSWTMKRTMVEGKLGEGKPVKWSRDLAFQYEDLGVEIEYSETD